MLLLVLRNNSSSSSSNNNNNNKHTVDTCKTLDNDCSSSKMSRLKSCMFPTASFTIVLISDNNPFYSFCLQRNVADNIALQRYIIVSDWLDYSNNQSKTIYGSL